MSIRQIPAPTGAASLRRHVVETELGPCTVRVQPGVDGPGAEAGMADVYLHGAAGSWTTFLPLLSGEPVGDQVLIDLPGWGESTTGTRPEQFTLEAMERVITGVLNTLGYARWNLVGHSMGGLLALHIAAARPDMTASVAAMSATTFAVAEAVTPRPVPVPGVGRQARGLGGPGGPGPGRDGADPRQRRNAPDGAADVRVLCRTRSHPQGNDPRARRRRPAGKLRRCSPGRGALRL